MSTPPNTGTTDLGVTGKIFTAPPQGRLVRNLDDTAQVFLVAQAIAQGSPRRASLASIDEIRAIATLAVAASAVLIQAIALVEGSDARLPQEELRDRLHSLCEVTRRTMKGQS